MTATYSLDAEHRPGRVTFTTVDEMLRAWSDQVPNGLAFRFLSDHRGHAPRDLTYGELWQRAQQAAGGFIAHGLMPGDKVVIVLPTGVDFLDAFFGAVIAGGVPVPAYPPFGLGNVDAYLARLRRLCAAANARFLCTNRTLAALSGDVAGAGPTVRIVTPPQLMSDRGETVRHVASATDTLFLQYTSGSTGTPKGVELTHGNILANAHAIGLGLEIKPDGVDVGCSWLPLCHDMGLIGCVLTASYWRIPMVLISPQAFVAQPARWLWAISEHRVTMSPAPNFAYELCARRVTDEEARGLDLSSWKVALNGAEPVNLGSLEAFTRRFEKYGFRKEALFPVYGLAEAALAVAFPKRASAFVIDHVQRDALYAEGRAEPAHDPASATHIVSVGAPVWRTELRVTDAAGHELPERAIGELVVRGPSVMKGYYNDPAATSAAFRDGWLRTGDLAYVAGGRLFIAGRIKDVIIKNGRKYYPQDVERAVERVRGVRGGCAVAFSVPSDEQGTEDLVVTAETRENDASERARISLEIERAALETIGLRPDRVLLLPARSVPKTTSGKLQRRLTRELYLSGRLGTGGRWPATLVTALALLRAVSHRARAALRSVSPSNAEPAEASAAAPLGDAPRGAHEPPADRLGVTPAARATSASQEPMTRD